MIIIIGDPVAVAEHIQRGREDVKNYRLKTMTRITLTGQCTYKHLAVTLWPVLIVRLQLGKDQQPQNLAANFCVDTVLGVVAGATVNPRTDDNRLTRPLLKLRQILALSQQSISC